MLGIIDIVLAPMTSFIKSITKLVDCKLSHLKIIALT